MNVKRRIKDCVADGIYAYRKHARSSILDKEECRVLMYHSIERTGPKVDSMGLGVAPDTFHQHMKYLKDNNLTVIRLRSLVSMIANHTSIPPRSIVITFDDGYESILSNALPVLKKFRYPATLFVNINFIERKLADKSYWCDWRTLRWDDLLRLKHEGVSIGSHGISHNRLNGLSPQEARREIHESKERIENKIGSLIDAFSYPQGGFSRGVIESLKEAGFTSACSSIEGTNNIHSDLFMLRRTEITAFDDTAVKFEKKLLGSYDWLGLMS